MRSDFSTLKRFPAADLPPPRRATVPVWVLTIVVSLYLGGCYAAFLLGVAWGQAGRV